MFKHLFKYWSNVTDTPYILSKINLFFYINIRIFKIKLYNYITYFIVGLNNLKFKNIKIYYNFYNFEFLYFKFSKFLIVFVIFLFFFF